MRIAPEPFIALALTCSCVFLPTVVGAQTETSFVRGDANHDGTLSITDAIVIVGHLFGGEYHDCHDAVDADDDGQRKLTDAIHVVWHLFVGGAPPPMPYPLCGVDPTPDDLGCARGGSCDEQLTGSFIVDVSSSQFTIYTDPEDPETRVAYGGFSGLCPVPGDSTGKLFYTVTDRGPGGDYEDNGRFVIKPDFNPCIVKLEITGAAGARIVEVLPLTKPDGNLVTGIPSPCVEHEVPLVDLYLTDLAGDPDGLDPEGITIGEDGNFWICDEFWPSVCKVAPDGTILFRLVPEGTLCGGEAIPTFDILPRIYRQRKVNKGFEGITIAPGGLIYVALQRPLHNPFSDTSRNIRILEIDPRTLALDGDPRVTVRQFLYVTEENSKQRKVYIGDICAVDSSRLLVAERRTDAVFLIDLSTATDITDLEDANGHLLEDPDVRVEQLSSSDLANHGIQVAEKSTLVDAVTDIDPFLGKLEGMTLTGTTLVLSQDNDFDINDEFLDRSTVPATIALQGPTNDSRLVLLPVVDL